MLLKVIGWIFFITFIENQYNHFNKIFKNIAKVNTDLSKKLKKKLRTEGKKYLQPKKTYKKKKMTALLIQKELKLVQRFKKHMFICPSLVLLGAKGKKGGMELLFQQIQQQLWITSVKSCSQLRKRETVPGCHLQIPFQYSKQPHLQSQVLPTK